MEIMVADHYTDSFDLKLTLPVALLHDTLEDTNTTSGNVTYDNCRY